MKYNTNDPEAVAIREKMERLKKYNKVEIYDVISIEEVRKFEKENDIKLPDDYVWFITNVANGCCESGYSYELSCGFYPLEHTDFSSEYIEADNWEDCFGEENFSLDISSTGCTGSYGIFLKGEHYGEISDNDEGLAYYSKKRVHGFKEWYKLLLDETLLGYAPERFDERISGKIEDILESYKQNHDIFYIYSIYWKLSDGYRKRVIITEKLMNDVYEVFSNETIPENKKELFFILTAIHYPDIFSAIEQIFIPENYGPIAFELNITNGIYFKDICHMYRGVVDGAGRYYSMIKKMLDYLAENESKYFEDAFRVAVMNPEFKADDIETIPNRDFVMKHIRGLHNNTLIERTEPYYTQAKNKAD